MSVGRSDLVSAVLSHARGDEQLPPVLCIQSEGIDKDEVGH